MESEIEFGEFVARHGIAAVVMEDAHVRLAAEAEPPFVGEAAFFDDAF